MADGAADLLGEQMLTIQEKDVVNGIYVGRDFQLEDVVVIPAKISRITFPFSLNVKGLMTGIGVVIICDDHSKIRHMQLGGHAFFKKNLFCGSLDATGTVMTLGDLVSWMGDLVSRDGSLIARGIIKSSGAVMAKNGAIVSDVDVSAEAKIFSLNTWTPKSGDPKMGLAAMAVREATAAFA